MWKVPGLSQQKGLQDQQHLYEMQEIHLQGAHTYSAHHVQ